MTQQAIIIVDDEMIVLKSLKIELKQEFGDKFLIEVAENGEEALEILAELQEDRIECPVVISDYIMPGLKGDQLLKKVYEHSPKTKNIMLTGQADLQAVKNVVNEAGLYRFITKPWDHKDLMLTVREAVKSFQQQRKIEEQNAELLILNKDLEKKVRERTQELQEKTEEVIQQHKELERANNSKDKLFSVIAHDLRGPIGNLGNIMELILDGNLSNEETLEFLEMLREDTKNAYNLLENLLDWSRTQLGRIKKKPELIDLTKIINSNVSLLRGIAKAKNVQLASGITDELAAFADENMVKTVVRNLISNAIKFTPENGMVYIFAEKGNAFVEVSVKDSGIGIPPENLPRIFDDEYFATFGTNREKGTGIGLQLCRDFVDQNGGKIAVESEVGQGSRFYFTLPQTAPE